MSENNNAKILGDGTIGPGKYNNIKIMGNATATGDIECINLVVMGEVEVKKNIRFDNINILGEMSLSGNCEGDYFRNKGKVEVDGLLSADKIEIVPKEVSRIEEIGGSEIIIKKSGWIDISGGKVISKLIEGDNITLQNTICNVVRGHDINILSGCSIDKIEYTGKLTIDKKSKVGEEICLRN